MQENKKERKNEKSVLVMFLGFGGASFDLFFHRDQAASSEVRATL